MIEGMEFRKSDKWGSKRVEGASGVPLRFEGASAASKSCPEALRKKESNLQGTLRASSRAQIQQFIQITVIDAGVYLSSKNFKDAFQIQLIDSCSCSCLLF